MIQKKTRIQKKRKGLHCPALHEEFLGKRDADRNKSFKKEELAMCRLSKKGVVQKG